MRASRITAHRQQREQAEQQCRDQVVAEFGADPQRLADEILRHRRVLKHLTQAVAWAAQGEPFGLIAPGPHLGLSRRPRAAGVACESDGETADGHGR